MSLIFRKKFFIDKQLQTKFILYTILLLMLYTLIFVAILFVPYFIHLSSNYPLKAQAEAASMVLSLHKSIWPALAFVVLFLGVLSIFVSHKVAGPIYRLKRSMNEIAAGSIDMDIKFRRRDQLHDLAASVNLVIHELRCLVQVLENDHDVVSNCISDIERQVLKHQISDDVGRELVKKLKIRKHEIAKAIVKYSAGKAD